MMEGSGFGDSKIEDQKTAPQLPEQRRRKKNDDENYCGSLQEGEFLKFGRRRRRSLEQRKRWNNQSSW